MLVDMRYNRIRIDVPDEMEVPFCLSCDYSQVVSIAIICNFLFL
jgi:hypothetical protein